MTAFSRTVLILATAVLYGLSFPPYGSALVAWFALVPFLLAMRDLSATAALAWAWISGLVMAYAITDFLPEAVATYYGQGTLFGLLLFVGSVSAMCCVSHMLFAAWVRRPGRGSGLLSPLLVGAAWVVAEFVRGDLEGNPWGTMGYTQARVLPMVQMGEWTGVYGVSFLLVSMNAAIADFAVAVHGRERLLPSLAKIGLVAMISAAAWMWGAQRLAAVEALPAGEVAIAVVQGNVDLGARWDRTLYGENLENYLKQTSEAARASGPEIESPALVFWPENAVTFFLDEEPLYRESIARVLQPNAMQLVTGGPHREGIVSRRVYNSAFVLSPSGEVLGRYDKRLLMPFAEYYPWWLELFLNRRFDGVREFSPGAPSAPLPTVLGPATVVTCNEALFPRTVVERRAEGGGFLVNLANDAWLGVHKYSDRVLDIVAMRSIEHRQYTVRASSSGGSAVVAPSGRVLVKSEPFAAQVLRAHIGPRLETTAYGRWGDVFVGLCALALLVAAFRESARAR
jgi:apolipoprotein N-acyltransferase